MLCQANAPRLPLRDEVVHVIFTSPPYWGLRKYDGLSPQVWGGDFGCQHEWQMSSHNPQPHGDDGFSSSSSLGGGKAIQAQTRMGDIESAICQKCGAWLGHLGNEPTPDLFVEHLVIAGREFRRVLRSDGIWFLNLGDSYVNDTKWGGSSSNKNYTSNAGSYQGQRMRRKTGLKPKDKAFIPHRVAIALQADGWWGRGRIALAETQRPTEQRQGPASGGSRIYFYADEVGSLLLGFLCGQPAIKCRLDVTPEKRCICQ